MQSFMSITTGTEHLFVCVEDCGMRVTAMPSHRPRQTVECVLQQCLAIDHVRQEVFGKRHQRLHMNIGRTSPSVLTAIFQMNLGQPVFSEANDDGSGGDNWSYKSCKAPVKLITTNKPTSSFLQAGCPSCAQPTVSKH